MRYSESEVGTVSIDGVAASDVVIPDDAQETAAVLAEAAALGRAVSPLISSLT